MEGTLTRIQPGASRLKIQDVLDHELSVPSNEDCIEMPVKLFKIWKVGGRVHNKWYLWNILSIKTETETGWGTEVVFTGRQMMPQEHIQGAPRI